MTQLFWWLWWRGWHIAMSGWWCWQQWWWWRSNMIRSAPWQKWSPLASSCIGLGSCANVQNARINQNQSESISINQHQYQQNQSASILCFQAPINGNVLLSLSIQETIYVCWHKCSKSQKVGCRRLGSPKNHLRTTQIRMVKSTANMLILFFLLNFF